jgi:hypothetical protein
MKFAIAAIILTALGIPTLGQSLPVGDLQRTDQTSHACSVRMPLDNSSSVEDGRRALECISVIGSWRQVIDRLPVLTPDLTKRLRIDPTATSGQLAGVFVAYVKAHPAAENKEAFVIFLAALVDVELLTYEPVKSQEK